MATHPQGVNKLISLGMFPSDFITKCGWQSAPKCYMFWYQNVLYEIFYHALGGKFSTDLPSAHPEPRYGENVGF